MSGRLVISSPLQGAAPTLQPAARPLPLNPGATPPAQRSPLFELAQSFAGYLPELHDLLKTAAAQADNDSMAQGELQAMKDRAATRLGELDTLIKQGVDNGTIPHARAPSFERGFRSRVGSEMAQSAFQEALLSQLPDATRVDGTADGTEIPQTHEQRVEKMVNDTYAQFSGQLHPKDYYARLAFDRTAEGIIAGFRQRAAEGYTANYKAAGEEKMADDNSERLLNLAAAPEDQHGVYQENVKVGLDQLRQELPKNKVNEFYLTNVVTPTIKKLVAQEKFTEARNILDEIAHLDVTGNNGFLGQTAIGKSILADLQTHVDREHRINGSDQFEALRRDIETRKMTGELAAGKELQQVRLSNAGQLPQDRFKLIDAYRTAHADDPVAVQGYTEAVNREFEGESKFRSDDRKVSDLEVSIKSLRKDDIDAARGRLEAMYQLNEIAPSDRTRLSEHLDKLAALYGAYDQADVERFKRDLYASSSHLNGAPLTINFGDGGGDFRDPNSTSRLWDALPPELQAQHESLVTQYFQRAVEDDLRNRVGDPNKVPAEKATTLDNATLKARTYAASLLRDLSRKHQADQKQQRVAVQAQSIQNARLTSFGVRPDLGVGYKVPGKEANRFRGLGDIPPYLGDGYSHPGPEADAVSVWIPSTGFKEWAFPGAAGTERSVVMSELAQAIKDGKDVPKQTKDRALYAYVKSKLGFTPEEVKSGTTKDGIPFNPGAIDPRHISVFRNKAELEANWNDKKPTPLFMELGNLLDPADKLTTEQFYLAQAAIFAARAHLYSNSR